MDEAIQKYVDKQINALNVSLSKDIEILKKDIQRGENTFNKNWAEFDQDIKQLRIDFKEFQEGVQSLREAFRSMPNQLMIQLQEFSSNFLKESVEVSIQRHNFKCMEKIPLRAFEVMKSAEGMAFAQGVIRDTISDDNKLEIILKDKVIKLSTYPEVKEAIIRVVETNNDAGIGSSIKKNFKQFIMPFLIVAFLIGFAITSLYYLKQLQKVVNEIVPVQTSSKIGGG